jgi:hypothetical protein
MQRLAAASLASLETSGSGCLVVVLPPLPLPSRHLSPEMAATKSGSELTLLHSCNASAAGCVVVEGLKLVRLRCQCLQILVVGFCQQPDLPRQALQEDAGNKVGLLLTPGVGLQHWRHNSDGFLPLRAGIWKSLSAFWKSKSW